MEGQGGMSLVRPRLSRHFRSARLWLPALCITLMLPISYPSLTLALSISFDLAPLQNPQQTEQDRDLQEADRLEAEFNRQYGPGKYDQLQPLIERVLDLREKHFGADHPVVAGTLLQVAILHRDRGDYAKAESLLKRALAIQEQARGREHPEIVAALYNLAIIYRIRDKTDLAEPLYQRGLQILEKEFGTDSPELTGILNELATLYANRGDYSRAELLYERELKIRQRVSGSDENIAHTLFSLAILYRGRGDYEKAEPLFQRALAIQEKKLGKEHPAVSDTLFNLAVIFRARGNYQPAKKMLERALAIQEKAFGAGHAEITGCLNELASLYRDLGDYEAAERAFQRVLAIRERLFGPEHTDVAWSLDGLASVYELQGESARAEPLYLRALKIWEKSFGANHPQAGEILGHLSTLYEMKGEAAKAIDFRARANRVSEWNLVHNLAIGSERQKLAYLRMLANELDQTISLEFRSAPQSREARELALTTLLQRKGRGLDAMADSIGNLRRHAQEQEKAFLDQLTETRSRLAHLSLDDPQEMQPDERRERIRSLESKIEQLEATISRRSTEFQSQSLPVSLETIRLTIPADVALIEFAAYHTFNAKTGEFGPLRYAAWVLRREGEVRSVDLGDAEAIEAAIQVFREALRSPQRSDVKALARAADQKVMRPVRGLLNEARHLLISPDGSLQLIPFAALLDESGKYLIERYTITYLTSGRDLLRLQIPRPSRNPAVIVADPEFGDPPLTFERRGKNAKNTKARLDDSKMIFVPLRGTREEMRIVKAALPEAVTLTKTAATEAALRQLAGPRILHIATHGFFLSEEQAQPSAATERKREQVATPGSLRIGKWAARVSNPLLRSGLALAGANQGRSGEDDGVLTALEAAGLNLWGTKLVVLSACDTGVGDVKKGDGVYGLRRALILAGSESQIMSLWPVSDLATRDLMAGYYRGLEQNQGRGEALRQVQLQMLQSDERQHPFYWASFIQLGEWANLEGQR